MNIIKVHRTPAAGALPKMLKERTLSNEQFHLNIDQCSPAFMTWGRRQPSMLEVEEITTEPSDCTDRFKTKASEAEQVEFPFSPILVEIIQLNDAIRLLELFHV